MVTLGATVHISGAVRRTAPGDTVTICWYVRSTVVDGSGERVDWTVSQSGVPVDSGSVTSRTVAQPDFSPMPSRMPLAPAGGMAPIPCFALVLDMDALPAGELEIEAVATGDDGTTHELEPVVVYNDTDGVDRRPSTKEVYCDALLGNDSNDGSSWAEAVLTRHRAMALARANPGGSSAADRDVGGAVIHCRGRFTNGESGDTAPQCHTSGATWLTFVGHDDCIWARTNPHSTGSGDSLHFRGHGLGACNVSIRLQGIIIESVGPEAAFGENVTGRAWLEGGEWRSKFWQAGTTRARYAEDHPNSGSWMAFGGSHPSALPVSKHYVTGVRRGGGNIGFNADSFIYDVEIRDTIGGNLYIQSTHEKACKNIAINAVGHVHLRNAMAGWGANRSEGFLPADPLEAVDLGGGKTRILGPVGGHAFGTALADNVGSTWIQCGVYGWPALSSGPYNILGGGTIGGRPYVDLQTGLVVSGAAPEGADIETTANGNRFNLAYHSSFYSIGADRTGDDVIAECACSDMTAQIQSSFTNGADHTRLLLWNVRDAGSGANWYWAGSSVTESLLGNISAPASGFLLDGGEDWSGTQVVNCVWKDASSSMPDAITNGLDVQYCHFVQGSGYGSNASTGAWLEGDPTKSPFSYEPKLEHRGTGHPAIVDPPTWAWDIDGGNSTKGCLSNIGKVVWSFTAEGDDSITATAIAWLGLFGGDAAGSVAIAASAVGTLPLFGEASTAVAVQGSAVGTLPLFGTASATIGTLPVTATASAFLPLFGSASGTVVTVVIPEPPSEVPPMLPLVELAVTHPPEGEVGAIP